MVGVNSQHNGQAVLKVTLEIAALELSVSYDGEISLQWHPFLANTPCCYFLNMFMGMSAWNSKTSRWLAARRLDSTAPGDGPCAKMNPR